MGREVITQRDLEKHEKSDNALKQGSEIAYPQSRDKYADRLFKYIPAEVVAGYIFVLGLINQLNGTGEVTIIQWLLFLVFCLITPLYLWRIQKVIKLQQHFISLLSFVVWVFALGGPFTLYNWYNPVYGEILLPVFTLIVAIWEAD
jgi:hypothetical protein